jgi:hypothetical protein
VVGFAGGQVQGQGRRTLLSAGLLDLGGLADADQPVAGLELLEGLRGVVDQGEAGGLAATELGAQAENADLVLGGLVHAGQLVAELILGDVGAGRVQDVTEGERSRERSATRVLLWRVLRVLSCSPPLLSRFCRWVRRHDG